MNNPKITKEILRKVELLGERIYYLYEILGVKVGVTQNLSRRQKEQKDKGYLVLLGEYTDIFQVSDIERHLQAEKGYHVDKDPYWFTVLIQNALSNTKEAIAKQVANNDFVQAAIDHTRKVSKEQVIEARNLYRNDTTLSAADLAKKYKVSVQTMVEVLTGRTKYREIPNPVDISERKYICEYCGLETSIKANYVRWHGNNCKHK